MPEQAQDIHGLVERCATDLREFAHTFRPETFYAPTPHDELTDKLIDLLQDSLEKYCLLLVHRGGGKTSWVSTLILQRLLYRQANCIMYCSLTEKKAMLQTNSLKQEMAGNRQIQALFGDMKSDKWSETEWQTSPLYGPDGEELHVGTQVVPRGVGQQVRGWLYRDRYRPDLIIVDDIEDRKSVRSEAERTEAWNWLNGEVIGCFTQLDILGPKEFPPKLVVIGNMLHEDCAVNRLRDDSKKETSIWHGKIVEIPMCDDNLKPIRPNFVTERQVKAEYNRYASIGELDLFAQECQLEVVSRETQRFKDEYYRYYDETEEKLTARGNVETVVCMDVTNTKSESSCPFGVIVQAVDLTTNAIYVREVIQDRLHVDEQVTLALDLVEKYKARCLSVGTAGGKEWIVYPFKNEINRRRIPVEFVPVPETRREGSKDERIASLIPLYRQRLILHAGHKEDDQWLSHCIPLELAQRKFPHSRYKDAMDAQSQLVWLLDNSERFMHGDGEWSEGASDDEYDELYADMAAEERNLDWKVRV